MKSFEEVADKECQEFLKSNTLTQFGMPGVNKLTNSIFTQNEEFFPDIASKIYK